MSEGTISTGSPQAAVAPRTQAASRVGRRLAAVWAGRGWWGGLIAFGLALVGQQTILTGGDPTIASRYYGTAIILLIAVLMHPRLPGFPRRATDVSTAPPSATAAHSLPVRRAVAAPATPGLPIRRAHVASPTETPKPVVEAHAASAGSGAHIWQRWSTVRTRLGWRVTAPGLILTGLLGGAATLVLRNNITDPAGGWLWAAALGVLLLTFLGAAGWPRGGGLLPGPKGEFFSRGLPRLSLRWEIVLIASILVIAAALRLYNLEYMPGIFGDEGERGMDARAITEGNPALLFGYGWYGVPNLYFYCVAWMLRLFGDNMVGDRMLSVISGLAAVWFIYRTGRLLWGPRAGLIAGALLTVSPLALQFSRVAGESTPTAALWAGGFYYFFLALRHRRWSDWVLAGMFWGFSLYFYAAGKLILGIVALVVAYCLVRWRLDFLRRYALGFVLLGIAFGLVFLPYALFSITDNWQGFTGRAQERSIFSAQNQAQAFSTYGIPYDPAMTGQPLIPSLLNHPLPWAQLVFQQLRVTTEVIYRSGDPTPFYQIQEHRGSMLAPFWAALALLGLAYGLWKGWDGRFGLLSIWFWGGMLGTALTLDTPSVQRLTGAWPVIMLFPAALLDRVAAAAWPLSRVLARRFSVVPLAALLIFFGGDSYREYFIHYASLCPYCTPTTQARYAQALGQDYKAYQLGVGDYDIFFNYGSTRFAAKGIEGEDLAAPVDSLPITDNNGKGVAFIVYGNNAAYLPLIRLLYPDGNEEAIMGGDQLIFTSYKLTRAQIAAHQTLHATYTPANGPVLRRDEPNLGTLSGTAQGEWQPPPGLTYPAAATWQGGLTAPSYGLYTLALKGGGDAHLEVDGQPVVDETTTGKAAPDGRIVQLVLAKGLHDVRLTGTLANAQTRISVRWGTDNLSAVPANLLFNGPTGGLSGEVGPAIQTALTAADPFATSPPASRRSDPALGFREATVTFGNASFMVRWQGTIQIPADGAYSFATSSNGGSAIFIDGQPVSGGGAAGMNGSGGTVSLTAGPHPVDIRYTWAGGPGRMEWFWTPPGGQSTLVPPTVLTPQARSWPKDALPNAPPAKAPPAPSAPAVTIAPDAVLGADAGLKEPRGLAVDAQGNVYVADSGNHRIVRLAPDGKLSAQWGTATEASAAGKFNLIGDLALAAGGGPLSVDVGNGDIQSFTPDGASLLNLPHIVTVASGIAVGPDGHIWVAETNQSRVLRFTPAGQLEQEIHGAPEGSPHAPLEQPLDVAVAPDGTAYVVDLRGRVVRLDSAGNINGEWTVPVGTARGGSHLTVWHNQVVISQPDANNLVVLDPASGTVRTVGSAGTNPGQFRLPHGVATGPDGRLYVVDSDNARVQVFSSLDAK